MLESRPMRIACLIAALWLPGGTAAQGQGGLALEITPVLSFPLGESAAQYRLGGGGGLGITYRMPPVPWLAARAEVDLVVAPTLASAGLILVTAAAGAGVSLDILSWLEGGVFATVGWSQGFYAGQTGGSFVVSARGGVSFYPLPWLGLALGAGYRHHVSQPTPFYQAFRADFSVVLRPGRSR